MPRSRRIWVVSVIVAVVTAGCGGSSQSTTSTQAHADAVPQLIQTAAQQLRATQRYTAAFTSRIGANGQSERASGSYNFATEESRQTITSTGGNTPAQQNGRPIQAVATGKLLYLLFPAPIRKSFPRPWLSFTARQYNSVLGQNGGLEAIKAPFFYGASGLRDQYAEWLSAGASTFTAAGTGRVDGVTARRYRGIAGPITMTITTPRHKSIKETYARLDLPAWLAGSRVLQVTVNSVAGDGTTLTQRFTITHDSAAAVTPPPAGAVVSYADVSHLG